MGDCEVCGAKEAPFYVLIERAKLQVCRECAKMGKIISVAQEQKQKQALKMPPKIERELVGDFAERIQNARSNMHIQREVLAEIINEKESFLERIEHNKARPTEELAKKLEKTLKIVLFEDVKLETLKPKGEPGKNLTLG
ncbi:MAG: multiprotein-bridging factor 1 family protein, partial [Candidatus Micrarchaeota archaeon]